MIKNYLETITITNPTLAIKAGSSAIVRSTVPYIVSVGNEVIYKAAGDMSALAGTIADDFQNIFIFVMDSAGTITTVAGTSVAITANWKESQLPKVPVGKALIGGVVIRNETGSVFTCGTTALDVANSTVTYFGPYNYFGK